MGIRFFGTGINWLARFYDEHIRVSPFSHQGVYVVPIKICAVLILAGTVFVAACGPKTTVIKPHFVLCRTITSEPSGAEIYAGKTQDNLSYTGEKTPFTFTAVEFPLSYYQVKKSGYKESGVKALPPATRENQALHFVLEK